MLAGGLALFFGVAAVERAKGDPSTWDNPDPWLDPVRSDSHRAHFTRTLSYQCSAAAFLLKPSMYAWAFSGDWLMRIHQQQYKNPTSIFTHTHPLLHLVPSLHSKRAPSLRLS